MRLLRQLALLLAVTVAWPLSGGAHESAAPLTPPTLSKADRQTYAAAIEHFEAKRYTQASRLARKGKNAVLTKVIRWLELSRSDGTADFAEYLNLCGGLPRVQELRRQELFL